MNIRIKKVRETAKLTQTAFGARLGLSQNYVWMLETGQRVPSDRTIRDICREFGVREEWLRFGDGEPAADGDRAEEVKARVEKLFSNRNAEFQQALISTLLQFEPDGPQWAVVKEIFESVRAKLPADPKTEKADLDSKPALYAELERLTDLEKGDTDTSEASLSTG